MKIGYTSRAALFLWNLTCVSTFTPSTLHNHQYQYHHYTIQPKSRSLYLSGNSDNENDETKRLLEKAAQLRAEIAKLENKPIEQVEQEARDKKQMQRQQLEVQKQQREQEKLSRQSSQRDDGRFVYVPENIDEQIRQACGAIERAYQDGLTRQTVRLALLKQDAMVSANPEEWPGGAQQMYREAGRPLTEQLLKELRANSNSAEADENKKKDPALFLAPNVTSQDIWDFDGSGLVTAEAAYGPSGDIQALVFPNTDVKYINDIQQIDQIMGKRLFLLINPFWRNVDTWGFNILAPKAKQKAQETIFDKGYDETYVLQRFSARGEQCVALKVYPHDWQLFAYKEDTGYNANGMFQTETAIRLGSSKEEPSSAMFTELLNGREEFKYSRNMRQMKNMF